MRIILISDTHDQHKDLMLNRWLREIDNPLECTIIHAGDVSSLGKIHQLTSFLEWYEDLPFKHKILISGNHDFGFETQASLMNNILSEVAPSVHYLNDSGITLDGLNFWGSPIQPWFHNWAFNRERGQEIKKHWDLIPIDTDILITHGPPYLKGDRCSHGEHVGCEDLLRKVEEIKPILHVYGHIHEGFSITTNKHTTFINASSLNEHYELVNKPVIFNLEK